MLPELGTLAQKEKSSHSHMETPGVEKSWSRAKTWTNWLWWWFYHLLKSHCLFLPCSQHWFMADMLTPVICSTLLSPLESPPWVKGTISSLSLSWFGWITEKSQQSPDIISGFPPAFIKVICYVYYYYFLNPFNFKHSYSLLLPLGPLCCTGHGLERSAHLRGQDNKDRSRCSKSTMNPACERRGARLAPKWLIYTHV